MRVLIAEDDLTSRLMLQAALRKWGYDVCAVADGDAAWAAMQGQDAPQLLLLDWVMPGRDGLTLCRDLRQQARPLPLYIIMLTARGARGDIIQGLESGADDYIAKPYDSDELRARTQVGQRILELQAAAAEEQRLHGVLEMAGAVCHELNQPLQYVLGYAELLLQDIHPSDPLYRRLAGIKDGIDRVAALTRKVMTVTRYRAKDYMDGQGTIVDLEAASRDQGR